MRVALLRLLSTVYALTIRAASGMSSDREWVLPGGLPTTNQEIRVQSVTGNTIVWEYFTSSSGSSGTVTSVGVTVPTSEFDVTGSPVTSSGTIGLAWKNQAINLVFASPASGAGVPTFRSLVAADIPVLDASKITTGTVAIARLPVGTTSTTVAAGNDTRFHNQNTDTGTNAASFQLNNGASGVRLKDTAGVLEVRNAADSAYADLTVQNLNVRGTQTIIDSNQVNIGDNILTLNADYTGSSPTENGGFEIERGTLVNASLVWDESADVFKGGFAGSELQFARIYTRTFIAADLSSSALAVSHNLNNQYPSWNVYDNNGNAVFPEAIATSTNILTLNFGNASITGIWRAVVTG